MPTPKNINIKFNASGNAIEVINKLSSVQDKLLKSTQKIVAAQQKQIQVDSNLNREMANKFATMKDVERQTKREIAAKEELTKKSKELVSKQELVNQVLKKQALIAQDVTARIKHQTQADVERQAANKKARIEQEKAIVAAKKMAKAQQHLAVNSKINTDKVKKLDKQLKKLGKSWKDAAVKGGLLRDAMRGNAAAMSTVNRAATHLIKKNKKLSSSLFALSHDGRLVIGSFATMRSKLLLFSFAVTMVTKLFVDQVKAFGKQEASVRRLADVYGSEAAVRLSKFSSELQKNSNFADENINMVMAQIGAFGASEKQTKALMQATVDLSAGLGIDLNSAGLLVAKTIGSSTDALTRYGVGADGATTQSERIANVIESVESKFGGLAETLSRTTEGQLNQASMAFGDLQERIGQVLLPAVVGLARGLKFLAESMSVKAMKSFAIVLGGIGVLLLHNRIAAMKTVAANYKLVTSYLACNGAVATLTKGIKLLTAAMVKNPVTAAIVGITALVATLYYWLSAEEELTEAEKARAQIQLDLIAAEKERTDSITDNVAALQEELDILNAENDLHIMAIQLKRDVTLANYGLEQSEVDLFNAIQAIKEAQKLVNEGLKEEEDLQRKVQSAINSTVEGKIKLMEADMAILQSRIALGTATEDEIKAYGILEEKVTNLLFPTVKLKETQNELLKAYNSTKGARIEHIEAIIAEAQVKALSIGLTQKELGGLIALIEKLNELKDVRNEGAEEIVFNAQVVAEHVMAGMEMLASLYAQQADQARQLAEQQISDIDRVANAELSALRKTRRFQMMTAQAQAREEKKITDKALKEKEKAKAEANKQIVKAFKAEQQLNIAQTIMNTATSIMKVGSSVPPPFSFAIQAMYAALGAQQIKMIKAQKPPTMAEGGLIGGKTHSQGGTLIDAERGEFVISRSAVDAIGVETLNRINEGQGVSNINITFAGNVLSQDFIENEAIPQIKDAVRRGADLGVS